MSIATESVLRSFGYPVIRDGLLLSIGGQEVYLGEACSGFRSLITLGSLGVIYIYLLKASPFKKVVMGASIIPLALGGNLLRVGAVCLVTYYVGVNAGQKFFHDFSGFVVFAALIGGLLLVEKCVKK